MPPHSFGDCLSVPDQSGTSTATTYPDASQKVWTDSQGGAVTIASIEFLQVDHSLLAGRVVARHELLGSGNRLIGYAAYQFFGVPPRLRLGFAYDQVEADAKTQFATLFSGCLADPSDFLRYLSPWFSPSQIVIDILGSDLNRRGG